MVLWWVPGGEGGGEVCVCVCGGEWGGVCVWGGGGEVCVCVGGGGGVTQCLWVLHFLDHLRSHFVCQHVITVRYVENEYVVTNNGSDKTHNG